MLRDYQQWAVNSVWDFFRKNTTGNPLVVMPTGTGKSHVLAECIRSMLFAYPRTRVMVLTHVKELIEQNSKKFLEAWPNAPIGIYSAGLNKKEFEYPITFGGIASVAKKADLFGHIDLLFVDECDLVSPKETTMYRSFINALLKENPKLRVIGLTATDWRSGIGKLTEDENGLFTHTAVDMSGVTPFNWFVDNGYLCPLVSKPTRIVLDTDNLHIRGNEFIESEMQAAFDRPEITRAALREAMILGEDRNHWLIFSSGVEHAQHISQELNLMDISCEAIYSGMDKAKRKEYIDAYKAGELDALANNNILTTGFDAPHTDMIVMLRATMSSRLWVQIAGRGTRPVYESGFDLSTPEGRLAAIAASGKHNCLMMDYARNIERLGPVNDPVIPRPKGKGGPQPAPVKRCPACDNHNHASARWCGGKPKDHPLFKAENGCGEEFKFDVKIKMTASTKEIVRQDELPVVEIFAVDHLTYAKHDKRGAPPILKVTYYCGIKAFTDYICLEHPLGSPGRGRATSWWRERALGRHVPATVAEASDSVSTLKVPTHISVWTNTKYPVIKNYSYDGTAFGTIKVEDPTMLTLPVVNSTLDKREHTVDFDTKGELVLQDDDIPF